MRTEQEIRERLREIVDEDYDEAVKPRTYFIIHARGFRNALLWVLEAARSRSSKDDPGRG